MINESRSVIRTLPDDLFERTRALNRHPVNRNGEFVLYWMHHAARGHENPALDAALFVADRLKRPLLVYQGLAGRHPYNSDRHHTFILEGAREVQHDLTSRGIRHCFHLATDPASASPLPELIARATLCLTEDFPAPPFPDWCARLADRSRTAFWAVDTACVLPMRLLDKSYARAYQFRNDTWHTYQERLRREYADLEPPVEPFGGRLGFESVDLASADIADLCAGCRIDHTVGPVPHTRGGSTAGYERWAQFKRHGLPSYDRLRNDAAVAFPAGVSRMSAYLHHGHVSPFRIAREAASAGGPGADKFLDEMLIWRELAHNFCFHHHRPDTIGALPAWAVRTIEAHRTDPRQPVFPWETLARARTGDPLWDAAQTSLLVHGELHNNVRMTWGKAILQWSRTPEAALQRMIDLNHRYALDGSDPNSYGGILWCLGLFDRPFKPEKPVIGTLRPRSTESHAARLDFGSYDARVRRPAGTALRVAVVGAGLSGLVAATTLSDHGHRVQVFEKAQGPGGRMATRRMHPHAFDHGAQYFTVRDDRFRKRVDSWLASGVVQLWHGRIGVLRDGHIRPEKRRHDRFVGVPGMSAMARHLADGLDICWRTPVQKVRKDGSVVFLENERGDTLGTFDALLVSAPPAQTARLLMGKDDWGQRLSVIDMNPCWALILAFQDPLPLPFDGLFIHGSDVAWAARNSSKPGRNPGECWVLHADAAWSAAHLVQDSEEVIRHLTASFFEITGTPAVEPVFAAAHCWRYAQARHPLKDGCLWDRRAMIGACGDWCHGSRIEGAFLSGAAAAGRVLSTIY